MPQEADRVVEIRARRPDGKTAVGSGFRVTDGLILTARHVVAGPDGAAHEELRLRRPELDAGWTAAGGVVWQGAGDLDAALVALPAGAWPGPSVRTRWARMTGRQAGIRCEAEGFPRSLREDDATRTREHLDGHVNPGVAGGRRYDVSIASAVPEPGSWGGMSGAALFAGQLLIGVIVIDTPSFNGRRLTAVPAGRLAEDPGFRGALGDAGVVVESVELASLFAHSAAGPAHLSVAMLLRADVEAVRFYGRGPLLQDLEAWCDEPAPLAARLLTGPGGQGKTRLARELCHRLPAQDWIADFVAGEAGDDAIAPLAHTEVPVLAVIDYAETRADQVQAIVDRALSRVGSVPIRLLLLARSAGDWWEQLIGASSQTEAVLAGAPVLALERLHQTPDERERGYAAAVADLARGLGELGAEGDWGVIATEVGGREPAIAAAASALEIQMAALADLLQAGPHPVAPAAGRDHEETLRRHEQRYWQQTAKAHGVDLRPPELLTFAVTAATFMGARTQAEALATVARVPGLRDKAEGERFACAAWLRDLYPAPPGHYWGTLQPDRLGEHLAAHTAQRTPELFAPALSGAGDEQRYLALTVLARAADRHPPVASLLADLLRGDLPGLGPVAVAVAAQTADPQPVVAALAGAAGAADTGTLDAIVVSLPDDTTALAGLAAELTRELVDRLIAEEPEPTHSVRLAGALNLLSARLRDVLELDDALAASQGSAVIFGRLAARDPETHAAGLADALNSTAGALIGLDRPDEAAVAMGRSVEMARERAVADPAPWRAALATGLHNLSIILSRQGRHQEALAANQEAMELYRELAADGSDVLRGKLGGTLHTLCMRLVATGRPEEALAACTEAVEILRPLAGAYPDAYRADLANALVSLGIRLSALQRAEDAVAATAEGVHLYRALTRTSPVQHRVDLAGALDHLGLRLTACERYDDAVAAGQESVAMLRSLAETGSEKDCSRLASALTDLALPLRQLGRMEEAAGANAETVELLRPLARAHPDEHRGSLAAALSDLAASLGHRGRFPEAVAAGREAVEQHRLLVEGSPDAHRLGLANSLHNLAAALLRVERPDEALVAGQEAVALYRGLADADRDEYGPQLADALVQLAGIHAQLMRPFDELDAKQQRVLVLGDLAARSPDAYGSALGGALREVAEQLGGMGRDEEAVSAFEGIVALWRKLQVRDGSARLELPSALSELGFRLGELGRHAEALAADREVVELWRAHAAAEPERYLAMLPGALNNVAVDLRRLGELPEAAAAMLEGVDILRVLAGSDPDGQRPALLTALLAVADPLRELRRDDEALAARREGVGILRDLADTSLPAHALALADALNRLGESCTALERHDEALACDEEALKLRRTALASDPSQPPVGLAAGLLDTAVDRIALERHADALRDVEEAIESLRGHERTDAEARRLLSGALGIAALLQEKLGRSAEAEALQQEADRLAAAR